MQRVLRAASTGAVSGAFGDDLKKGILAAVIFPILLLFGLFLCRKSGRTSHN